MYNLSISSSTLHTLGSVDELGYVVGRRMVSDYSNTEPVEELSIGPVVMKFGEEVSN